MSKPIELSVIICTHNPRSDYFCRVLEALKNQSLSLTKWELLLIDNLSNQPLAFRIDLSWHANARHIREEQLGLTPARLRGIREAKADILVFVDDDNVLNPNYLENVIKIGQKWQMLGAWGGQALPQFEQRPPEWTKPYWWMLTIRELKEDKWSNRVNQYETIPVGAGLCVRKIVADKYDLATREDTMRLNMDRKGGSLTSGGDIDLAFTACDIGLGIGVFTCLSLTHLIPVSRLNEDYLLRLRESISYSMTLLESFRGQLPAQKDRSDKFLQIYKRWRMDQRSRRLFDASQRGIKRAQREIEVWLKSQTA